MTNRDSRKRPVAVRTRFAVVHEKERTKALVLLERPDPHTRPDPINLPALAADDSTLPKHLDQTTAPPPGEDPKETSAASPSVEAPATPETKADAGAPVLPPPAPELIEPAFKAKAAALPELTVPTVEIPNVGPALGQQAPALPKTTQPPPLPSAPPLVPPTTTPATKNRASGTPAAA